MKRSNPAVVLHDYTSCCKGYSTRLSCHLQAPIQFEIKSGDELEGSNIVNEMNRNAIFGIRKMDARQEQKGKVPDHNASASRTAASQFLSYLAEAWSVRVLALSRLLQSLSLWDIQ